MRTKTRMGMGMRAMTCADCSFALAYGATILLNMSPLCLKRGYHYGLCGKNDTGMSTLMHAITDGQV